MNVYAVPAKEEHIEMIAGRLKQEDVAELWASARQTPIQALTVGFHRSMPTAWTIVVDGHPEGMFGCAPFCLTEGNIAAPWMLGTDEIGTASVSFLRQCRKYVEKMNSKYNYLMNMVDARNKVSIRWLKWCGFNVDPAKPYGLDNMPFHKFWKEKVCVAQQPQL